MSKTDQEPTCSKMKGSDLVHKVKDMMDKHQEKIKDVAFYVLKTGFRILMFAFILYIINKFCPFWARDGQPAGFRTSFECVVLMEVILNITHFHFFLVM